MSSGAIPSACRAREKLSRRRGVGTEAGVDEDELIAGVDQQVVHCGGVGLH